MLTSMVCRASAIFFLCIIQYALCVPKEHFYTLDSLTEEMHEMASDVRSDCQGNFGKVYRANGESFTGFCVLRDGGISLYKMRQESVDLGDDPFSGDNDIVAPFWCAADISTTTDILYGNTSDKDHLPLVDGNVRSAFPGKNFTSTALFISTWTKTVTTDDDPTQEYSFQAVIAMNDLDTCVIFQYADNMAPWSICQEGHAKVGISIGNKSVVHNSSGTAGISAILNSSNIDTHVDNKGRYVYCIGEQMEAPETKCEKDGALYRVNDIIMISCDKKLVCQANGTFRQENTTCPAIDGPQCYATGDPHYLSWDGRRFDFQGRCEYVMARSCGSEDFVISANNNPCGHQNRYSCVRGVRIKVPYNPKEIFIGQGRTLYFSGIAVPQYTPFMSKDLIIRWLGSFIYVTLREQGILVIYDGSHRLYIRVSTIHRGTGKLCGLCGNYDGNASNDLTTATELQCPGGVIQKRNAVNESDCDANNATLAEAQSVCNQMKQTVFNACNQIVDPQNFINDCVFDYCNGDPEERQNFVCGAMANYASKCADLGLQSSDWRREIESCSMNCPKGMMFQQCGPACLRTCENMGEVCEGRCVEGCFCPDGKYLLKGSCVEAEMCTACEHNGVAVLDGQQIQPNCSTRCTCRNGAFYCESQTCLFNGATCYAAGDPHYQTFDLRNFDFQGNCEYVLTTPCGSDEFSVAVRNEEHNERVTFADRVRISGGGQEVILSRGNGGTISIDGSPHTSTRDGVILETDLVYVARVGGHPHVIFPTYGVRIFWDGLYRVEITVSTRWRNRLCGLCGNYNGDSTDDFMDQGGNAISSTNDFGNSWIVGSTTGCTAPEAATCDTAVMNAATIRCKAMSSTSFFEPCKAVVDPKPFEKNCVYDECQCNDDDRQMCFCESLATYASACAAAGVTLPNWRKFMNCPVNCPAGTTFQQCGSLCPQTCNYLNQTCHGGCAEGCFCPTGQMVDRDGTCRPMSTCLDAIGSAASNHGNFTLQVLIATIVSLLLCF